MATDKIVLDEGNRILSEYGVNLRSDGQPGVGDAFLKWVYTYQWNSKRCDRVRITPTEDGSSFAEFPHDRELTGFDLSDRMFVAAARARPRLSANSKCRGHRLVAIFVLPSLGMACVLSLVPTRCRGNSATTPPGSLIVAEEQALTGFGMKSRQSLDVISRGELAFGARARFSLSGDRRAAA